MSRLDRVSECLSNAFLEFRKCGLQSNTNCCATAARLQNAVVTATALNSLLLIFSTRVGASYFSVISSSASERIPQVRGTSRTLPVDDAEISFSAEAGSLHSDGILSRFSFCFAAAIASQSNFSIGCILVRKSATLKVLGEFPWPEYQSTKGGVAMVGWSNRHLAATSGPVSRETQSCGQAFTVCRNSPCGCARTALLHARVCTR